MYKIKVLRAHRNAVMINGKKVRRDCVPNEEVYVQTIDASDIKSGLYRVFREQIITPNDDVPVKRERPVLTEQKSDLTDKILGAVSALQQAMTHANMVIEEIKNLKTQPIDAAKPVDEAKPATKIIIPGQESIIPESGLIDEGEEIIAPYDQAAYQQRTRTTKNMIANSVDLSKDQNAYMSLSGKAKMPAYAEVFKQADAVPAVGEILIEPERKENKSTEFKVVTKEKGEVDVIKSLGLEIFQR